MLGGAVPALTWPSGLWQGAGGTVAALEQEATMAQVTPFTVAVAEEVLVDLRDRLARTRWIDGLGADERDEWTYGVSRSYLQELCTYWRTTFDWRGQEAILNAFD